MATVHGLPLSLGDVRIVFGAPVWTALSSFVRGGPWVPDVPTNAGVPTSKPISLGQLVGATSYQPIGVTVGSASGATGSTAYSCTTLPATSPTVTGGTSSKTYSWTYVSGSTNINCLSPSGSSTHFQQVGTGHIDRTYTAVWRITVSDGITSGYADCTVTIDRLGDL